MSRAHCEICGRAFTMKDAVDGHRCPARVIAAIDAAHARDDSDDVPPDRRTYGGRLAEGFRMLQGGAT